MLKLRHVITEIKNKQDLLENYVYWFNYYKSKYKLGDDK